MRTCVRLFLYSHSKNPSVTDVKKNFTQMPAVLLKVFLFVCVSCLRPVLPSLIPVKQHV